MKDIRAIMRGKRFFNLAVSQMAAFYSSCVCVCLLSLVTNGAKCFNQ